MNENEVNPTPTHPTPPPASPQATASGTYPTAAYPTAAYPATGSPTPGYPTAGTYPTAALPEGSATGTSPGYQQPTTAGSADQTATGPGPAGPGGPPPGYPPGPGYPGSPYSGAPYPGAAGAPDPRGTRRLTRSRTDRMVGGVCGGLARYWNTDPVLLRILTVVLTLATGGALLIGYLLAWIAIPDEPGPGGYPPGGQVGYAAGGNPPYADTTWSAPEPVRRERSYLGWLVLSVALLAVGLIALVPLLAPASFAWGAGLTPTAWGVTGGVVLIVLGVGMLIGTWYGRARWLAILAVPLVFVTFGAVATSQWVQANPNWDRWSQSGTLSIGERTWNVTPEDLTVSPLSYQLSVGDAVLDLTDLTATGTQAPNPLGQAVYIEAGVGLGQLIVLVPDDVTVNLDAALSAGNITTPEATPIEGSALAVQTSIPAAAGTDPVYVINLDVAIGAGNLEVRHATS